MVNNFLIIGNLGSGSYGKVLLCEEAGTERRYAMKVLRKSLLRRKQGASGDSAWQDVMREIAIMKKLNHPNVVQLVEVIDNPNSDALYLITEFVVNGPPMQGASSEPLPLSMARKYLRDVLKGLHYLHHNGISHRDLKPGARAHCRRRRCRRAMLTWLPPRKHPHHRR